MTESPDTKYVTTPDGLRIAYQVVGDGPLDIVLVPNNQCVDMMWEEPTFAAALGRLARIGRLVCIDYRGFGASDPVPLGSLPTAEAWMEDTTAVLDAIGSTKAAVMGESAAGFIPMLFAATYPERTSALVLVNSFARWMRDDGYTGGTPEVMEGFIAAVLQSDGTALMDFLAPSRASDADFRRWGGRYERLALSPSEWEALTRWALTLDVRAILSSIRVPTLILHRRHATILLDHARYLADHIHGAALKVLPGQDTLFFSEDADALLDDVEEFLTGVRPVVEADRVLATVLFTDIVDSTPMAAEVGDNRWKRLLDRHDSLVRQELARHRGNQIKTTGDGVLATFDGPARAVRCAQEICAVVKPLGIEVRAGLHTGEVELRGDDIGGIAVHIGQRVSALAGPGEVLVSRTVTDLVAGSGLQFEDRGEHELKGVPGRWSIYAVSGE